ncbi:MAG: tetratricopeptide repeat protein [Promethearchaeota archaeon]
MTLSKAEIQKIFLEANKSLHSKPRESEELYRVILQNDIEKSLWYEVQSNLAYSLWLQSKSDDAHVIYQILLEQGNATQNQEVVADAYVGLARITGDEGSLDQSVDLCQKAIAIYQNLALVEKEALVVNVLAATYYYQGNIDQAISWFKKCLQLIPNSNSVLYPNVLNNLGMSHRLRGEIEKSGEYFHKAIENAENLHFDYVLSTYYNNLAETLCLMGDYQNSLQYFKLGMEIAEKNQDLKNIALVNTSYANYLIQTGQLELAYSSIMKAIQIYDKINDPLGEILSLIAIANYWMVKGHLKKAQKHLEKAWAIVQESGVTESAIDVLVLLAEIHEGIGETDVAYDYLKTANQITYDRNSDLGRVQVLVQRGLITVNQNQFHEAELILNEAIWIAEQINHHELQYKSQVLLARNYLGQYAKEFRDKDFQHTMKLIQQAKELAKAQKLIPRYINALIIQGMLYSSSDDDEMAKMSLSEAKSLASERGMILQARNAQERLSLVTGSGKSSEIKKPFKQIVLALIMDEISRTTTSYLESSFSEIDLEETFMTVFTIDDQVGTRILETENIDIDDPFWYKQIHQIASLYSISLGQGEAYHEGLFGPLPFGETDLRSIIFTRNIAESNSSDINSSEPSRKYVLFCLVFPREMMPLFYDRKRVEIFFTEVTDKITTLKQITKPYLERIHETIISEIIADIYDPVANID